MQHTDTDRKVYYEMTMNSKSGCSKIQTDEYFFYLGSAKFIVAFFSIIVGLASQMAGRLILRYFVVGSMVVITVCMANFVLYVIYNGKALSSSVYWTVFLVFTLVGLLLAWISTKYKTFGYVSVSLWLGFEIGACLSTMVYQQVKSNIFFWMIIIISMITIAAIVAMDFNQNMIWVTAMIGAYVTLTGLSTFTGQWPINLNLPKLVEIGAVTATEPSFYLYMTIWLSMSIVGVIFQCMILWYYKKSGKKLHPRLQEAVDKFQFGQTAEQRKLKQAEKRLQQYCENEMTEEGHDSLYLDLESRRTLSNEFMLKDSRSTLLMDSGRRKASVLLSSGVH